MRRYHLALWATILLVTAMLIPSSSDDFADAPVTRFTKIVRIALLPICNPGLSCDPDLPAQIGTSFFRSSYGVASFISEVSLGNTRIVGTTLPWLRAKKRLQSADDLIAQQSHLIALAHNHLQSDDVDIYVFYLKLGGPSAEVIEVVRTIAPHPKTLAFMVNTAVYEEPQTGKPSSVIVPSTPWALAILRSLGVNGTANTLHCGNDNRLAQCTIARGKDPYSILGDMAFSLAPPLALTRTMLSLDSLDHAIEQDGSYQLNLAKRSHHTLAIQLKTPLVLNDAMQFDRLYIEQKRLSKFDRRLRSLQSKELKGPSRTLLAHHEGGAFLYLGSSARHNAATLLIDANPKTLGNTFSGRSALLTEFSDTTLLPGSQFKLFDTTITLEVTQRTATSLTIKVAGLTQ